MAKIRKLAHVKSTTNDLKDKEGKVVLGDDGKPKKVKRTFLVLDAKVEIFYDGEKVKVDPQYRTIDLTTIADEEAKLNYLAKNGKLKQDKVNKDIEILKEKKATHVITVALEE